MSEQGPEASEQQMRRRSWLCWSGWFAFLICLLSFVAWHQSEPHLFAESRSPYGGFRAVVFEQRPPILFASPYRYRFSLHSIEGDDQINGTEFVYANDSAALDGCQFTWKDADRVEVVTSQNQHFVGKVGKNGQTWESRD
jgi:hypothetical protein